ncbi:hypothetical protein [Candidatus Clostridium stratigraminis]|uniref:Uncharacterized protein n=1 Tax=Candidatus Clostridium stratigraminis TaxID=3381661 RepID=A0ABW8T229_9CLOT
MKKYYFKKLTLGILLLTAIIAAGFIPCEYPDPVGNAVTIIQNV